MRLRSVLIAGATAIGAVGAPAAATLVAPRVAGAQTQNPYQRGPAPTTSSISASRGPFAIAQTSVSRYSVTGFGGGTIYYPTSTAEGTFGAVAVVPGFTGTESTMAWYGPRLASQGFVVFTIATNSLYDQPASRGDQLLAALDYLTQRSSVRTRIDPTRLAVMGHSMGGGGTLEAAKDRPSLQAAIPLTGWNTDKTWPEVRTPTLVIGAENDTIAPVATHSIPFYNSLPSTLDKAYLELDGASHLAPNTSNTTIAKYSISWLKRFVDNDTRYEQFLCGARTRPTSGSVRPSRTTATRARTPEHPVVRGHPGSGRPWRRTGRSAVAPAAADRRAAAHRPGRPRRWRAVSPSPPTVETCQQAGGRAGPSCGAER